MDLFSFLNASSVDHISSLYDRYLQNPDGIEPSWRAFFQGFDFAYSEASCGAVSIDVKGTEVEVSESLKKEFQVVKLIDSYRSRGHLFTKTNPVRTRRTYYPNLAIENFGLSQDDLSTVFSAGEIISIGKSSLKDIISHLESIYCESIGAEYMYIRRPEEVQWIQQFLNFNSNHPKFTADEKKNILIKLNEAVSFENFLHTKYVGQKRFSLEGGESLIPALGVIIEKAADMGVEHFVMGMAHRGRLNVLLNIFGKSARDIFSEFEGKDYDIEGFDGDVKYHLGWTRDFICGNKKPININLVPNPSHLETVGAVVQGITRAKQERHFSDNFSKVLPIVVHGDAAISGQGLAYEVVQMSKLDGYKTNGTIHIVVNNQIGFTTNYVDGRSSVYCTDVAKVTLSPVLHVNADDAEAVVHASNFALKYRMKFKKDVFIDLLGYRKYGHNEGDEPKFTQPILYKSIMRHKNPRDIYAGRLIGEGIITTDDVAVIERDYKNRLERELEDSRKTDNAFVVPFMQKTWEGFRKRVNRDEMMEIPDTSFPKEKLLKLAQIITTLPLDKKFLNKIKRLFGERHRMIFADNRVDWAMGEQLAYASLLSEGFGVRISGQDVERGTFSHRHAVVKVEDSEEEIILLKKASESGAFHIYNSLLSEYGVLGFDYGYAMARPDTLTVWEAQFGDFSNGAQIIIDQYVSSAEDKWKTQNGLVMFLPHGFEGQGAEHSSARMERYLQLCSRDNMFVADCTTPANLYHLLRRQMKLEYRKPLVVFTPKSLLRHPLVVSSLDELAEGCFRPLIDDDTINAEKVKSVVFCTGKFYYDLLQERTKLNRNNVALVRIEQLFPLPETEIHSTVKKYTNADDFVWAQEEPRNMGAYSHMLMHCDAVKNFRVAARRFYSSPASGSSVRDARRQREVLDYVFDKTKKNI